METRRGRGGWLSGDGALPFILTHSLVACAWVFQGVWKGWTVSCQFLLKFQNVGIIQVYVFVLLPTYLK